MASSSLKNELAHHIYQYLCHEAQYSDLPEAARESLTAASECIEQAYKLNVNNTGGISSTSSGGGIGSGGGGGGGGGIGSSGGILSDELLKIFTRHKEFLSKKQQKDSNKNNSSSNSNTKNTNNNNINNNNPADSSQNETASGSSSSGHKLSRRHLIPRIHHRHSIGVSVHQKNFKQKLIALIKKFRTDGSSFDSEEQYREALERELMKAAAGRGSRAIEELLEEDIDVEEESGSEPEDWDNISEKSAAKPSLRPFFSSTTLDKI